MGGGKRREGEGEGRKRETEEQVTLVQRRSPNTRGLQERREYEEGNTEQRQPE
jgi:hypothetical protein